MRVDDKTMFRSAPRALNLLGVIWLCAARYLDAGADFRTCEQCKAPYDAWDKVRWKPRKNRSPRAVSDSGAGRRYCSNARKQRAYRVSKDERMRVASEPGSPI